jgi:hypothetical protein
MFDDWRKYMLKKVYGTRAEIHSTSIKYDHIEKSSHRDLYVTP